MSQKIKQKLNKIINEIEIEKPEIEEPEMEEPEIEPIELEQIDPLFMWDFDFDFYTIKSKITLTNMVYAMFEDLFYQTTTIIPTKINMANKIDKAKLYLFIYTVSNYYHDTNAFHNFSHAVSVVHFLYMLITTINMIKYIDNLYLFALMIAALIHDIDHPGNNNQFEINLQTMLAKIYNDKSVLENHHCSIGFYLMELPYINLLSSLSMDEYFNFRICIIESIISTDMSNHQNLLDKLTHFDKLTQLFLCQVLLHASDLSNSVKPFAQSNYVVNLLQQEHKNQLIKEAICNISISKQYLFETNKELYFNELYFSLNIVLPLYELLEFIFPEFKLLANKIKNNSQIWLKMCD